MEPKTYRAIASNTAPPRMIDRAGTSGFFCFHLSPSQKKKKETKQRNTHAQRRHQMNTHADDDRFVCIGVTCRRCRGPGRSDARTLTCYPRGRVHCAACQASSQAQAYPFAYEAVSLVRTHPRRPPPQHPVRRTHPPVSSPRASDKIASLVPALSGAGGCAYGVTREANVLVSPIAPGRPPPRPVAWSPIPLSPALWILAVTESDICIRPGKKTKRRRKGSHGKKRPPGLILLGMEKQRARKC
jgi:hypothetical protein